MRVQDYLVATDEQLSLVLSQAEQRLADQHSFAQAADARAATVTSAAAALATASVGAFAASLTTGSTWPLAAGALVASLGFAQAARKALTSARCLEFHPRGYRPADFEDDIRGAKPIKNTRAEMAEDYQERLQFNATMLSDRGDLIDASMGWMWRTPALAAFAAAAAAVLQWIGKLPMA